jgi:hypothetical protein
MTANPDDVEIAKKYLELALNTDKDIQKAYEMVTDKIKTAFTLTSALITAVAALGYFIAKETSLYWILIPVFVSLMTLVIALAIGIESFRPTTFTYVDPMEIVTYYKDKGKSLRSYLNKWACTICDTTKDNAGLVNSKESGLNKMYFLVVLALGIFAMSFLFLAINLQ